MVDFRQISVFISRASAVFPPRSLLHLDYHVCFHICFPTHVLIYFLFQKGLTKGIRRKQELELSYTRSKECLEYESNPIQKRYKLEISHES